MKIQVLFLTEIHFSSWHYRRFGVDVLKARDIDVVVLDCTKWLFPEYYETHMANICVCPERIDVGNHTALEKAAYRINAHKVIAFDNLGFTADTARIRRKIYGELQALRGQWQLGLLPQPKRSGLRDAFRQLKGRVNLSIRVRNRSRRFLASMRMGPPDLVMLSGHRSGIGALSKARHKIWCHSFDYDEFLSVNDNFHTTETVSPYAVYLDENIVGHPDRLHGGYKPVVAADRFYPRLNRFFSAIEDATGLPVVIAAHPKSDYSAQPDLFEGRRIETGRSAELVRGSSLVLGHTSCSLNFPMLWRKPVCILTSDDLDKSYLGGYIAARAAVTGVPPFNIDRGSWPLESERLLMVNKGVYDAYRHDYIKIGQSPDKPVWEIFADYVEHHLL